MRAIARETETLCCCRRVYRRWRLVGRHFPSKEVRCSVCGVLLLWLTNYRPPDPLVVARERQKVRRIRFALAGLRSDGAARVRVFLTPAQRAKRNRDKYHRIAAARLAAGLTTRGTPRRYRPRWSRQEIAWRAFREELAVSRPEGVSYLDREAA